MTLNTILLQNSQSGGGYSTLIMIAAMVIIFYFFMIRPQQKQRKKLKEQRERMTAGSKVVTAGGIHGILREKSDSYLIIEIDKGVQIRVNNESVYPVEENK